MFPQNLSRAGNSRIPRPENSIFRAAHETVIYVLSLTQSTIGDELMSAKFDKKALFNHSSAIFS